MKLKTWILALVLFGVICLATDLVVTHGFVLRSPISDSQRIQHLYAEQGDEIPIFGPSRAHGHYIPSELGLNAFNYGMNGASYEVADVFLQIELAKPKTSPIIIEFPHRDSGLLSDPAKFIPFVSDPRMRQLLNRFQSMDWKYYLPGLRYFGNYDGFLRDSLWLRAGRTKISKGYSELVPAQAFDRVRLDEAIKARLAYTNGYYPDEDQNRRMVAQITAHPQRLFFLVVSPYHRSYYVNFQNADKLAAFEKQLSALPNVVVIDWGQLDYPDEYFLDTLHLRREPAAEFSRKLGNKIREVLRERSGRGSKIVTKQGQGGEPYAEFPTRPPE
jgi:hypothetical protein